MGRPKKILDENEVKKITLFDHLKNITTNKGEYLGDEGWNNWMINRYLSMEENYCEVVNFVQKSTWRMEGKYLYDLYKNLIPKQYIFLKYIKNENKKEYDMEQVYAVSAYFEISKKEAKEYISMLSEDEVVLISKQINGK